VGNAEREGERLEPRETVVGKIARGRLGTRTRWTKRGASRAHREKPCAKKGIKGVVGGARTALGEFCFDGMGGGDGVARGKRNAASPGR